MNGSTHNLCRPACLVAETQEEENIMNEIASQGGTPRSLDDIQSEADSELVDRREAKLASHIREFKGMKTKTYDPVLVQWQWLTIVSVTGLLDYQVKHK